MTGWYLDGDIKVIENIMDIFLSVYIQVARDTSSLITYKESCSNVSEDEMADIDRKIQANRNLLDQCLLQEMDKSGQQSELNHLDMGAIKNFDGESLLSFLIFRQALRKTSSS